MISIEAVKTGKQKKLFRNLTDSLYVDYPHYVPQLKLELKELMNPNKHPFFESGEVQHFLAYQNKKVVGRISAIKNQRHNDYYRDKVGFFGLFECIHNQAVANQLLDAAKSWLLERGFNEMRGPANYSSNETQGLLIDGFDSSPAALLTYNPPYYRTLLENYGLVKQVDLYAYRTENIQVTLPIHRPKRIAERLTAKGRLTIRPLNLRALESEIQKATKIFNDFEAINTNNFVPMTENNIRFIFKNMKPILDPNMVYFAEEGDRVVGFACAIPDVNELFVRLKKGKLLPIGIFKLLWYKHKIRGMKFILLGIKEEYKRLGLGAALMYKVAQRALTRGMDSMEMSMVHEDNEMMKTICENYGGVRYKHYRIYKKGISDEG